MEEDEERKERVTVDKDRRAVAKCLWFGIAALLAMAAAGVSWAQSAVALPPGVKAVWDMSKAWHEDTPTRACICINGLWRWQPAQPGAAAAPAGDWGYFKVPGSWPGTDDGYLQHDSQTVFANPAWGQVNMGGLQAAWYERTFAVPAEWTGRRVTLATDYLNSWAEVYIDGKPVGTMRYPAGEVDLTAACKPGQTQTLAMHVIAMPLRAVMLSFGDTNAPKEVRGSVPRRGLCGDVYLVGAPAGPRIEDMKADTSVRNWQITFNAALDALAPGAAYRLKAAITDHGNPVVEFTSNSFTAADLKDGRFAFTCDWHPAKLWDTITPQNQYDVHVSLTDAADKLLDASLPVRFGFREFWINGRDFYLNGTRIRLSSEPLCNAQIGVAWATYDSALDSMKRLQNFGINYVNAEDYDCTPGSTLGLTEILRAADDCGMLFGLTMPEFGNYDWKAPDAGQTNGYAPLAAYWVRVAENHPSVVFYPTSHNATGYFDENDPDKIEGRHTDRDWDNENVPKAMAAQAIINRLDPTRIVYHHAGGDIGDVYSLNFYINFAPIQELSDWFAHWAAVGEKPFFTCEYAIPGNIDWTMYRGWYNGKRYFGNSPVPWQLCICEWNSQFLGDKAFRISDPDQADMIWEAKKLKAGQVWYHWDYPYPPDIRAFQEFYPIYAMYITDNYRAFRTLGVSATTIGEYSLFWTLRPDADTARQDFKTDWDKLQQPGYRPDFIAKRFDNMAFAYKASDWEPTLAGQAVLRNNMPLLACIGGKPGDFSSKGHNFMPGETVQKQLIIINNSRLTQTCDCSWSLTLPAPLTGVKQVAVETGDQARIPLEFTLPASLKPGPYKINATVQFSAGEPQSDSFTVNVVAAPSAPRVTAKIALFDPKGETKALLDKMGVRRQVVDANADLSPYDVLVVGKEALALDGPAPDISRVRDGLRVIIFEQASPVLEKRFGFRTIEYGLRNVFERVPDSPLLAGLTEAQLHDWRGEATLTSPRIHFPPPKWEAWDGAPVVEWAGLTVPQAWRVGNRGNVSSVLIEKPACGDFLPIIDGGYSLQFSPLMLYREGQGMVLFCEMDVTGRTEEDPAAEQLAGNILSYVQQWQPGPQRTALYAGDAAGLAHLQASGLVVKPYAGGALAADQVLVVAPGAGQELAAGRPDIAAWLKAGGNLLAIGLNQQEADSFLPAPVTMRDAQYISACFTPADLDSLTVGVGPADVHNRDPRQVSLVTGGADPIGDGVMARGRGENVVFYQLVPWTFSTSINSFKRTFRRTSYAVNRILADMGCEEKTPLLARFSQPVGPQETRYLSGLYLDKPEDWDNPYRYFGW
jgi:hypothetical protein